MLGCTAKFGALVKICQKGNYTQKPVKYSKTCVKQPLKNRQNNDLIDKWWLNEGRKYCRMLHCNTFDLH